MDAMDIFLNAKLHQLEHESETRRDAVCVVRHAS